MTDENNPTRSARNGHTPMPTKGEALRARGGSAPQAARPACPPAPPPALARAATTDTHGVAGKPRHPARRSLSLRAPLVLLVVLLVTCAALLGSPRAAQAQTAEIEIWSDTMTVGSRTVVGLTFLGWNDGTLYPGSVLLDEDFDYGGHTYNLREIYLQGGALALIFNDTGAGDLATKATRDKLTFHVGGTAFNLGNGDLTTPGTGMTWSKTGLTWSDGDTVALKITTPQPNAAPDFGADSATREVAENSAAGTDVGDPVTATDADNDTLTYTLEGTDAASFDIVSTSGQIRTKAGVTYDYETTPRYAVVVKADDSNGGTDTIAVAIDLLDVDEAPDGTPATAPTIDTVSVTSDPGADETYAIGDTIEVTVTFDQEVKVTGRPRITLRVGGDGPEHMKSATYADAFSVALLALRFTYGVADGDGDDDGIDLEADKLELAVGGTIQGASGGVDAILAYPAPGTQGGHKVDGRRPTPTGAVIPASGDTITLTFSETVSSTTAAPGAFAVTVGPGAPSVSSVAVSGQDVTLTLARVVAKDQPVSVTYTDPSVGDDSNAVQDEAGNDAKTFTQPVTNNSEHISAGPDFGAETATREVAENSPADTNVGDPVDATATDPLTYSLAGTDAAAFAIVSASGQIRTTAGVTYDHEAAKNAYAVTVTADDGTDGTDATATVAVTITVTDVRERPSPPARPTVRGTAGEDTVTLEVSWREPENTGPPISDYDVRVATETMAANGAWFTWGHHSAATSTTITDFFDSPTDPSVWVVQVRAFNAELRSEWSESGSTTDPSPPDPEEPTPTPDPEEPTPTPEPAEPPGMPSNLSAMGGNGAVTLTWDAPADDGGSVITGYRIEVSVDGGSNWTERVADTAAMTYTHRNLPPGETRHYRVSAINAEGMGAPSAVAHATTTRPLGPPRNLRATGGDGEATLTWDAPTDDGGSAITGYEYRYAPAETEWLPVGLRRVTVTGLKNRERYRFEVRAVNDLGEGAPAVVHVTVGQLDRVAQAWLSRFGRTVATHVTDAVGERLRASPGQGSHLTVGGYRLPLRQPGAGA